MSGLDPIGRREIRQLIGQIHDELPSTTIFFSTHILADVEELCSAVAVIRKGHLTHSSPIEELIHDEVNRFDVVVKDVPANLRERLERDHRSKETPMGLSFSVDGVDLLMTRLAEIRHANVPVVSVVSHRRNLEEALFTEMGPESSRETASLMRAGGAQ
jgi:ABC-2 type transport system ATP-binding protein